jgi:hypothetical protein
VNPRVHGGMSSGVVMVRVLGRAGVANQHGVMVVLRRGTGGSGAVVASGVVGGGSSFGSGSYDVVLGVGGDVMSSDAGSGVSLVVDVVCVSGRRQLVSVVVRLLGEAVRVVVRDVPVISRVELSRVSGVLVPGDVLRVRAFAVGNEAGLVSCSGSVVNGVSVVGGVVDERNGSYVFSYVVSRSDAAVSAGALTLQLRLCDAVANVSSSPMSTAPANNVSVDPRAVPFAAPRGITSSASVTIDVRSTDLDGDGDVDVVGSSAGDDTLRWYENNGAFPPVFTSWVIAIGLDALSYVDTGDVDDDGDIDIVASSPNDNRVTLHVNDGGRPPSFSLMNVSTEATATYFSCFGDVDGDGDLDVVSSFIDRVVWFENTSNRSRVAFGSARSITSGLSGQWPYGAAVADIDRDGDVDAALNLFSGRRVVLHASDGALAPQFSPV